MKTTNSKNYEIRNFHSYIKKDNVQDFKNLIKKKPFLLDFKNFRNENILFYSLFCGSEKITNYLIHQKPQLLLERNNVGRNPVQNIANKQLDFDFVMKNIFSSNLFKNEEIISNVDNLGNNLLMYLSLYPDMTYYNKLINENSNINLFHRNKKGSNLFHFLCSNNEELEHINIDLFDSQILMSKTNNLSNPLMFAAEKKEHKSFKYLINKYKEKLHYDDFNHILTERNSLGFSLLDFAFLNKTNENVKYLIENFEYLLNKDINTSNALIIIKQQLNNNNLPSFIQILEHYQLFETSTYKTQDFLSIFQSILSNNDKNPLFVDYILKHKFSSLVDIFSNDDLNLNKLNLEKLTHQQWTIIFENLELQNPLPSIKKVGSLFPIMMNNQKYQLQNLNLYYSFIKKNEYPLENFITQSLLFLQENTIISFLNSGFFNENKNKEFNALLFLFQNIYDLKDKLSYNDINPLSIENEINIYKSVDYKNFNYINNLDKIINNKNALKSLFYLSDIEKNITSQIIRTDEPFTKLSKIFNICDKEQQEFFIKSVIYDIYYLAEKNIKINYSINEWNIFKQLYSDVFLSLKKIGKNENLEMIENFFGIFESTFSQYTIDYQLDFLDFISKNNYPIDRNQLGNTRFIQKTTETICNNIQNNTEESSNHIKKLIDINIKLFDLNIPMNIPKSILNLINKNELIELNKTKKIFFDKIFKNSTFQEQKQGFSFLKNYYCLRSMDYFTLDEMIKEIPIERNKDLSIQDKKRYMAFYYPELFDCEEQNENQSFLQTDIINRLIYDYLKSNQLENIVTLQYILINNTDIYFHNIDKYQNIEIDTKNLNNLEYLNIYSYHCPNKLKKYEGIISPYIDTIINESLSLKNINIVKIINILNILEKIDIIEQHPQFIKNIIESNKTDEVFYSKFLEQFILRNKKSSVFDNIDFNKIENKVIAFYLEESFLERNIPVNNSKNKVLKF